jgi:hypothetical protein
MIRYGCFVALVGAILLLSATEASARYVQYCRYAPGGWKYMCYTAWVADELDNWNQRSGNYERQRQHRQWLQQQPYQPCIPGYWTPLGPCR